MPNVIATAIRTAGDMVMVFDRAGRQVPECQGLYPDVRELLLHRAAPSTVFKHWFGNAAAPRVVGARDW